MSKRQPPTIRAGSGDSHEARLAVLEQRFSDDMQARCSWCNHVRSAKQGEWIEVVISSPGTGVRPAHVFRCMGCEAAPVNVTGGLVAVPSGARRPGQSPPPLQDPVTPPRQMALRAVPAGQEPASSARRVGRENAKVRRKLDRDVSRNHVVGAQKQQAQQEGAQSVRPARKRPQAPVFPGTLSPAP